MRSGDVMEHTAALWKYRPVPADEPEPFPEYRACRQIYPGGTITAASVRGKKHKHEGTNCDDWFAEAAAGELLFAAVSDGAGSCRFSRIGAREACCAAVEALSQTLGTLWTEQPELSEYIALDFGDSRCMDACRVLAGAVQQCVLKAREAVEAAFRARSGQAAYAPLLGRPLELRDLSATLLAAAVFPAGAAGKLTIACQTGDGCIALLDSRAPAAPVKLLGTVDSGPFSGETEFLTSPRMGTLDALQSRTKLTRGHSDLLFMMTDGVADDYFPAEPEMHRLYGDLCANKILGDARSEAPEERLKHWLDTYIKRGSFDDRTLLILEPNPL